MTTEANDHGMDCGPQGLSQNLDIASQTGLPDHRHRQHAAQAFAPYRITIDGQRIAIIAATQVIADQPDQHVDRHRHPARRRLGHRPDRARREVQQVRRTADTVIVYVHWGTETAGLPRPAAGPLASSSSGQAPTS